MTSRNQIVGLAAAALMIGALGVGLGYWLRPATQSAPAVMAGTSGPLQTATRTPLYYQDPDGKADYSPTPKKTADGRSYRPTYDETASPGAAANTQSRPAPGAARQILYYRNPMGLADTSPVPKKDSMGMDYIPIYQGDDQSDVVTVSAGRMQMLGVRTATVESRTGLARTVRATGVIEPDENRLAVVTTKFDGFVEKLFVATTGATVRAGQSLARVWIQTPDVVTQMGPDVITRQIDYIVALQDKNQSAIDQAIRNLRNYGIPDSAIAEIRRTGRATRSVTITAPLNGTVLEKTAVEGMRFAAGDPLFKLANLSTVWLIADVAEQDLGAVRPHDPVAIQFVSFPGRSFSGSVDFVYPALTASTRTGRVRIVLANPGGELRGAMYASVSIAASAAPGAAVLVVPDSAVIDSGARQVVLVARGQGRFEPRAVHVGTQSGGYTQIVGGLKAGEQVVTGANFLIDAESNLRAALASFDGGKP